MEKFGHQAIDIPSSFSAGRMGWRSVTGWFQPRTAKVTSVQIVVTQFGTINHRLFLWWFV
jgi:hypothetical protein